MRRREFIAGLGATAAYWPVALYAQQSDRPLRVGVLMAFDEADSEAQAHLSGFKRALAELGWFDGRAMQMEVRWAAGSVDRARMYATELVDWRPNVVLADSTPEAVALHNETRTIPIVFVRVSDPVGEGLVAGLPRPGGNFTGFIPQEPAMAGKWLEFLREIAPGIKRVAIMFNPETAPYTADYLVQFEAGAQSFKVTSITAPVRSDVEIEAVITSLGRERGSGLVVAPGVYMDIHRATAILQAARNNVPAVYAASHYVKDGGLLSYGPDYGDLFRRAATYVDRILKGAKPAELPVQLPIKFEMAVNLKTAKALGLTVPNALLALADEVIE